MPQLTLLVDVPIVLLSAGSQVFFAVTQEPLRSFHAGHMHSNTWPIIIKPVYAG
jgi:hypothetical protein